jgi:hypothetical protein
LTFISLIVGDPQGTFRPAAQASPNQPTKPYYYYYYYLLVILFLIIKLLNEEK